MKELLCKCEIGNAVDRYTVVGSEEHQLLVLCGHTIFHQIGQAFLRRMLSGKKGLAMHARLASFNIIVGHLA